MARRCGSPTCGERIGREFVLQATTEHERWFCNLGCANASEEWYYLGVQSRPTFTSSHDEARVHRVMDDGCGAHSATALVEMAGLPARRVAAALACLISGGHVFMTSDRLYHLTEGS